MMARRSGIRRIGFAAGFRRNRGTLRLAPLVRSTSSHCVSFTAIARPHQYGTQWPQSPAAHKPATMQDASAYAQYRPATASIREWTPPDAWKHRYVWKHRWGMGETPSDRVSISACTSPLACWSTGCFLHAGIHRHLRLPRVRCSTPHLSAQCVVSCRDAHARTVLYRECAIR